MRKTIALKFFIVLLVKCGKNKKGNKRLVFVIS